MWVGNILNIEMKESKVFLIIITNCILLITICFISSTSLILVHISTLQVFRNRGNIKSNYYQRNDPFVRNYNIPHLPALNFLDCSNELV